MSHEEEYFTVGEPDSTPTNEPRLTQLDDSSRDIILNTVYKYGYTDTTPAYKVITKTIYPELEKALSYAGSHLNSVMYYRWPQAQSEILFWEGLFYDPLSLFYEDDPKALRVLDALNLMLRRSIKGGSELGKHQEYNVKMAGAYRIQEVRRSEQ